jgi:hypothetical protein
MSRLTKAEFLALLAAIVGCQPGRGAETAADSDVSVAQQYLEDAKDAIKRKP